VSFRVVPPDAAVRFALRIVGIRWDDSETIAVLVVVVVRNND